MSEYSHNDYWTDEPIEDAIEAGLNAFEADIVYVGGEIMCSHSWRPFKSWCHGSLEEVYLKPLYLRARFEPEKLVLIIEPKSVRKGMLINLYNLLNKYQDENITFITGVQYKYFWQRIRLVWLYDFHRLCKRAGWRVKTFDKRLETDYNEQVDVYHKYSWWKRILKNQF